MFGEVIAGPIQIYRAPVGTVEPLPPSDMPPAPWALIGGTQATDEVQTYSKDGLNIAMTDEREEVEVMNELYPIDEFITSARQKFEVKLKDMTIETLALLLGNSLAQTARPRATRATAACRRRRSSGRQSSRSWWWDSRPTTLSLI